MSASKSKKNSTKTPWCAIAQNQTVTHICELIKFKALTSCSVPNAKHGSVSIAEMSGMAIKPHVSKWWTIGFKAGLRRTKATFPCVQCAALALRKTKDATTWHAPFVGTSFAGLAVKVQAMKTTIFRLEEEMAVVLECLMEEPNQALESPSRPKKSYQCVRE